MNGHCKHGNEPTECELCNDSEIVRLEVENTKLREERDSAREKLIEIAMSTGNDEMVYRLKKKWGMA